MRAIKIIIKIYPDRVSREMRHYFYPAKKFHINSDIDINGINPDTVFEESEKFMINTVEQENINVSETLNVDKL
ncbi:MAG: hypothetical protein ABI462_05560 [Ignavibacteria bacterium]